MLASMFGFGKQTLEFKKLNFTQEGIFKVDGLTCVLNYKKGRLESAVTRGNGTEGEDVTANALQAQDAVLSWMDAFPILASTPAAWRGAMDLCVAHQLANRDALVLNVAAEGRARLLLTEDLKPGFSWRGVRVVNPLVEPLDPLLLQVVA